MTLADLYPEPDSLIKNECDTLRYLMNEPILNGYHPQFAQAARNLFYQTRKRLTHFEFESFFNVCHQSKDDLIVVVCGKVEPSGRKKYKHITYCMTVCRQQPNASGILRKLHFDVTSGEPLRRMQGHPICHLQYCGSFLPFLSTLGYAKQQMEPMHPWLSEPRIPYWPMSLALIVDLAFREFPSEAGSKFREKSEWQSIIRKNEALLLANFYSHCLAVIGARGRTLAESFYGD